MTQPDTSKNDVPLEVSISDGAVPLESVLCTEELGRRPRRPPDYAKENRALVALASGLANSPHTILQTLAETILDVTQSDSAGVSLLRTDDGGKRFYWPAIAGTWKPHIGGGTPRNFGPCGDVLDCNSTLLFRHLERRYTYFLPVTPPAVECLLVPFHVGGKAVGTIWALLHDDRRKYDAEDERLMNTLGQFASLAYQALASIDDLKFQIAEREKAEQGEDHLRLVVDTTPALIHTGRPDGYLDYFNQRWLEYLGLSLDDLCGWRWTKAIHPDDVEDILEKWRSALASGEPFEAETRVRRADGEYRRMLHRKCPLRDNHGKILKWYGSSLDIEDRKQAENELRRSEFFLAEGQRLAHMGSWALNPAGFFDYWSRELFQIYGLDPENESPTLEQYLALVHPQDREFMARTVEQIVREQSGCDLTKRIVRPNGNIRYVRCVGVPVFDHGAFKRIVGTAIDVTEQEHLTQKLRRREAYLAEAQRLSHTGSFGWSITRGELFWSEETFQIFEYDRPTKPTVEMVLERVHPEDAALVKQTIERASQDAQNFEIEHRLLMPDGSIKYLHVVAHAASDESGAIEFVGAVMDVTRSKQAEERIRQDERELRQLIDSLPQHVIVLDKDGRLIHANQMVLDYTGRTLKDVRGVGTKERIEWDTHPDDLERARGESRRGLLSGAPFEIERRALGKNGQYRWFLFRYKPLIDEERRIARWFLTATDIEDRKREEEGIRKENIALREEIDKASMFEEIVGSSEALRKILSQVAKVAPTDSTVLILGETGTGKELIARGIHSRSNRSTRAFIRVNCAAIPPSLIASELFGHEKGAFTGALQRRLGRFESADGGTIFLDEVGELPMETQIAFLRVLQEREFERVGGSETISVNVRVLAAANRDLGVAVAAGTFRQDLFYRLNVFPIHVPALRDRREDIPLLVEYMIERYGKKAGKKIRKITKETLDLFQAYDWPGNIRELQNVVERAVILCDGETFSVDETWLKRESHQSTGPTVPLAATLVEREKEAIESALAECQGRISGPSGAAAKLGIPRQTLESKIAKLGIDRYRFKRAKAQNA